MRETMEMVKYHLEVARARQKARYDKSHKPNPEYQIGDMVWLRADNIKTRRPCKKLDDVRLGPFKVIKKINIVTYEVELPSTMKIHNVFHVDRLDPVTAVISELRTDERPAAAAPVITDHEAERLYAVKEIVDSRVVDGQLHYKIDWEGYSKDEQSWEPAAAVAHLTLLTRAFHKLFPNKPRPRDAKAKGAKAQLQKV